MVIRFFLLNRINNVFSTGRGFKSDYVYKMVIETNLNMLITVY